MKRLLITGGAGFIGTNAAEYFIKKRWHVTLFDNLSRRGAEDNLVWLQENYSVSFIQGDLRSMEDLSRCFEEKPYDLILHLGAQVAVTLSVSNPREDFEINALGTLNLLEAVRHHSPEAVLIYSSTNKVYGGMESLQIINQNNRYEYADYPHGISEAYPLDFHSPYGCSKGCADQYVLDYARIYGLKTVSFRQSCIYGKHQHGVEDQGWVAWFTIAVANDCDLTLYGDGMQIRDVLYVEDLAKAYESAYQHAEKTVGQAYNMGGGSGNTLSLLELLALLEKKWDKKIQYASADWRPGDQKVFVADIRKAEHDFNWRPEINVERGVDHLIEWISHSMITVPV